PALAIRRRLPDSTRLSCKPGDPHVCGQSTGDFSALASDSLKGEASMAEVLERPDLTAVSATTGKSKLKVIDCDIHPSLNSRVDLYPFLAKRWQHHLETYGSHLRTPFTSTTPYPRSSPLLARRDAWPPTGGPPGSDLAFMRQ